MATTLAHIVAIWLGLCLGATGFIVLGCYTRPWFERRAREREQRGAYRPDQIW
jgi:hypothetical protein